MTKFVSLLLALIAVPLFALAQTYPSRTIHVIVPYPAGGSLDTVTRVLGQRMAESMGQAIVVENRPGGNGIIGGQAVAAAPPDGYTLMVTFDPPHTALPYILRKLPFDPVKDFTPITMVAKTPQALVVNSSLPVRSLKEFIEYAKANPGNVFCGTPGTGTSHHFALERLNQMAKIKVVHVPYKGAPPAVTDLLGGQLQAAISTLVTVNQHLKSGKLRALAVTDGTRARSAPDIPTIAESGLPGYSIPDLRVAVFGPAGMAPALVARVHDEIVKAAAIPAVRARLEELGFELIVNSPREMAEILAHNLQVFRRVAAEAGIQPE